MSIIASYNLVDTATGETLMEDAMAKDIASRLGVPIKTIYNAASRHTRVGKRYTVQARDGSKETEHTYSVEFKAWFTEKWNRYRQAAGLPVEEGGE